MLLLERLSSFTQRRSILDQISQPDMPAALRDVLSYGRAQCAGADL